MSIAVSPLSSDLRLLLCAFSVTGDGGGARIHVAPDEAQKRDEFSANF